MANPGMTRRLDRTEALKVANVSPESQSGAAVPIIHRLEGRFGARNHLPDAPGSFDGFDVPETGDVFVWYEAPKSLGWWARLWRMVGEPGPGSPVWPILVRPLDSGGAAFSPALPTEKPGGPAPPPPTPGRPEMPPNTDTGCRPMAKP